MRHQVLYDVLAERRYRAGEDIELSPEEARPLIDVGAIRARSPETTNTPPEGGEEQSREAALLAAIAGLEKGNPDHWIRGGAPQIAALETATGLENVSAVERDAAWAQHQAASGDGA